MSMRMGGVYMGNQILRRTAIALFTICLLSLPALGNSGGPPYLNGDGNPTAEYGCSGNAKCLIWDTWPIYNLIMKISRKVG